MSKATCVILYGKNFDSAHALNYRSIDIHIHIYYIHIYIYVVVGAPVHTSTYALIQAACTGKLSSPAKEEMDCELEIIKIYRGIAI